MQWGSGIRQDKNMGRLVGGAVSRAFTKETTKITDDNDCFFKMQESVEKLEMIMFRIVISCV